ncbi:cupin domain-containing protein [Streptomyces sp. BH104]|uniref:cupin domain-containing protein n=1 Tax=Streptomyces sp. BH104 TaxID=3410407 RepID=UPI003BB7A722
MGSESPSSLEMWDWTMYEGDSYQGESHIAETKEMVTVLNGSLEIQVAGEPVVLDAGDSAVFAAERPHTYRHTGQGKLRFVLAVAQPHSAPPAAALDGGNTT